MEAELERYHVAGFEGEGKGPWAKEHKWPLVEVGKGNATDSLLESTERGAPLLKPEF